MTQQTAHRPSAKRRPHNRRFVWSLQNAHKQTAVCHQTCSTHHRHVAVRNSPHQHRAMTHQATHASAHPQRNDNKSTKAMLGISRNFKRAPQRCHQTCSVNAISQSMSHLTNMTMPCDNSTDLATQHSSVKRRHNNRSNVESLQDAHTDEKLCCQTCSTHQKRSLIQCRSMTVPYDGSTDRASRQQCVNLRKKKKKKAMLTNSQQTRLCHQTRSPTSTPTTSHQHESATHASIDRGTRKTRVKQWQNNRSNVCCLQEVHTQKQLCCRSESHRIHRKVPCGERRGRSSRYL